MKKSILILSLLGAAASAKAQAPVTLGPWVQGNLTNVVSGAPGYQVLQVSTVSSTVAWSLAKENTATGTANYFFKTNNAAGTEFNFDQISAPGSNAAYESANISAVSGTTAIAGKYGGNGGGEILRTTNGGTSWTKTTATSDFTAGGGFLDFVHMFDANEGVAVGDPVGGYFEIRRTTNGGASWTRIASTPVLVPFAGEAALVRSFCTLGNTIWFGGASGGATEQERIFKSTDRGLTWTVSAPTPLTENISKIAFKDPLNGIAYNLKGTTAITAVNLIRTSDGGATWQTITPTNTATGSFFISDIDAVNGRYYSVGSRFPRTTPSTTADFGTSYSVDGVTWRNLSNIDMLQNDHNLIAIDVIANGTATGATGYAGSFTDANGVGGMYRAANIVTATRDGALQTALTAFPNPSATGVFNVDLGSTLKAGAQLTVVDALGRVVKSQNLSAAAVGARNLSLDLSTEKAGVYTLQIQTADGIATRKLVVE